MGRDSWKDGQGFEGRRRAWEGKDPINKAIGVRAERVPVLGEVINLGVEA